MKITEFSIIYGTGIDQYGCVLDVAIADGLFTQKGAWIYYSGELFAQGRENALTQLRDNPELFEEVKKHLNSAL